MFTNGRLLVFMYFNALMQVSHRITTVNRLEDLSRKTTVTILPVFMSQKINDLLKIREKILPIVNQQCVVYKFSCDLCDTGYYIGYTMRHLEERVQEHKHKQYSSCKHYLLKYVYPKGSD